MRERSICYDHAVRPYLALLLFSLSFLVGRADPPRALPVDPSELTNGPAAAAPPASVPVAPVVPPQQAIPGGVNIHWYGHGFVYLTSSLGVRAAIDPFGPATVHYPFPPRTTADFVLISHEAEDHAAAAQLFGNPLIFRSVTAVGLNRANGISFRGVALQKDPTGHGGSDTAFELSFDHIKFCYLGQISVPFLGTEKTQLGQVDVVFLPVGINALSVTDFDQVVRDLGAKIIIPVNYKTELSGDLDLRDLDAYLSATKFPVRHFDTNEIVLTKASLPPSPTIFALKSP